MEKIPASHRLKFHLEFKDGVVNEGFCLSLARVMGLRPVAATIEGCGGDLCLRVERFDIVVDEQGRRRQLRQMDFRAAMGFAPGMARESSAAAQWSQCFDLLRRATQPSKPQLLRLLDYAIFNALIGHDAATARSFALLCFDGHAELAPLHDTLCTAVYPTSSPGMAMKVGGESLFDAVQAWNWQKFAQDAGLDWMLVENRVLELAQALPPTARKLHGNGQLGFSGAEVVERIVALLDQRCSLSIRRLTGSGAGN